MNEFIEKNIKPCPFCGNSPRAIQVTIDETGITSLELECCMRFQIESDDTLQVTSIIRGTKKIQIGMDAIQKWNRRAKNG